MECYTSATTRLAQLSEAAEVPVSIEAVLATLHAFDAEKCSHH